MIEPPKVIVLQHAACETLGSIETALRQANLPFSYVRSFDGEEVPPSAIDYCGLVVMGGPQSAYEEAQYPYLARERRLIESALKHELPVLGICLGSQLIAHALGAKVYPGAAKEIGWYQVKLSDSAKHDALFAGVPPTFMGYHWHGDVFDLPAGAELLASSAMTPHQAFRFGKHAYGLLFHMEVTRPLIANMTTTFTEELHAAGGSPQHILAGADQHLSALEGIGHTVFSRWAELANEVLCGR